MKTETAHPPQTQPITGPTRDSSAYSERESRLGFKHFEESAGIVIPIMENFGELLEAIFLAKGHKPDSVGQRRVDLIMRFICSLVWEGGMMGRLEPPTDEAILAYFAELLNDEMWSKRSWRELWHDPEEDFLGAIPLRESALHLFAYGYHGLWPSDDLFRLFGESVENKDYIRRLLEASKTAVVTVGLDKPATRDLNMVLLAAEGRLALDEGRDVTPEQLAALARISIKSMRNALAPKSGSGLRMRDGAITAESVLNWLRAHGKYKATLWPKKKASIAPVDEPIAGEILFVPFASDDIEFDPVKCRRDGKYTVGPRGAEQTFIDYRTALDSLARMQPASYWKHPNKANNWGTVTAVGFRPRATRELGLEPAEGGEK
jgi:hypothetical protein